MANRDRDYQTGNYQPRGGRDRHDEGRYSSADDRRDYPYTENDEGDSSVRAGSYDQGRVQYSQYGRYGSRDRYGSQESNERSSGRYAGYGDFGQGDYSGGRERSSSQDRHEQGGPSRSQGAGGGEFRGGNYGGGFGRGDYGGGAYGGANRSGGSYGGGVGASGNDLNYGAGTGRGFSGYGYEGTGSRGQSGSGQSGFGQSGYGSSGGWTEPYGEGQQYDERGRWGGQSGFGSQNHGGQGGLHRGKGPKGYQRTDERLKELICERLRDDPEIDPSEVTISVQGGKVTLEGTVESRHAKNAIEDVAEQFGVQEVQNNLRVQRASLGSDSSRSTLGRTGNDDNDRSQRQNKH